MVFGFGKKKTQEQPTVPVHNEKTISLDGIPAMLHEIETPHIVETINIAKATREEVEIHRKKIRDLILHLESDDLKLEDVDRNLGVIVKRGKDSIVSTIKKETSTNLTSVTKYDQAVALNLEISQMLKKIGDVLGLNSRIIHIFAKKYADNLKEEIAKVAKSRNHLQSSINIVENLRANSKIIIDTSQKILEYRNSTTQKNERILEIEAESQTLKDTITTLERQIHELKSSSEHAKFLEIKHRIDVMSSEKSEIKNIIDLQFSKISRPLGRYSYISSFEKPVRKMMDDLVANPYDVISLQNKAGIIQILEAVEKSVVSGAISVKDSDKSLEQIQETISRLDEFILLKESYSNKVSLLEKDLTVFDIKFLESKEHELEKTRADLANIEAVKKKLEADIKDNNQSLSKSISNLESGLARMTNTRVLLK